MSSSPSDGACVGDDDLNDEVPCCRVCHGESEPDRVLFFPCKCDGTIKYVHQDCLISWIEHKRQQGAMGIHNSTPTCELCGEPFHFRNIYKTDTPLRLTVVELAKELLPRVKLYVAMIFHASALLLLWGAVGPLLTALWFRSLMCWTFEDPSIGRSQCTFRPLQLWMSSSPFHSSWLISLDMLWELAEVWLFGLNALTVVVGISFFTLDIGRAVVTQLMDVAHRQRILRLERDVAASVNSIEQVQSHDKKLLEELHLAIYKSMKSERQLVVCHCEEAHRDDVVLGSDRLQALRAMHDCILEDIAACHIHWSIERTHTLAIQKSSPQRHYRIDRETLTLFGESDLEETINLDLKFVRRLSRFVSVLLSTERNSLSDYINDVIRILEHQKSVSGVQDIPRPQQKLNMQVLVSGGLLQEVPSFSCEGFGQSCHVLSCPLCAPADANLEEETPLQAAVFDDDADGDPGPQLELLPDAAQAAEEALQVPRIDQEHHILSILLRGYRYWFLALVYLVIFTFLAIVVPMFAGKWILSISTQTQQAVDIAQQLVAEVLERHIALAARLQESLEQVQGQSELMSEAMQREKLAVDLVNRMQVVIEVIVGQTAIVSLAIVLCMCYWARFISISPLFREMTLSSIVRESRIVVSRTGMTLLSFLLYFAVLPSVVSVILLRALSTALLLSRQTLETISLDSSLSMAQILLVVVCYILSLVVIGHSLFVGRELRKLLSDDILVDILPKELIWDTNNDQEANDVREGAIARLIWLQRRVRDAPLYDVFRGFINKTLIVLVGVLVTAVLPLKWGHWLCFSKSPLTFRMSTDHETETALPAELLVSHVLIPLIADKLQYTQSIRSVLQSTLMFVSDKIGGRRLLNNREREQFHNRIDSNQLNSTLSIEVQLSIVLLSACLVLSVLSSLALHWPIYLGRFVLDTLGFDLSDLFSCSVGLLICWAIVVVVQLAVKDVLLTEDSKLHAVLGWVRRAVLIVIAGGLWITILPMLLGYILESLFIIPVRASPRVTVSFPVLQAWAVGVIVLKLFVKSVVSGLFGDIELRTDMEMTLIRGFARFEFSHFMKKVFLPILLPVLDFVGVPFVSARILGMFSSSYVVRTMLVRYSLHAWIAVQLLWRCGSFGWNRLIKMHNEIRDSRYLVGTQLTNRQ